MNEQLKGKRFSDDIDKILNSGAAEEFSRAKDSRGEDDYAQMLDLAWDVVTVDYSADSKIRKPLLDKLFRQMAAQRRPGFAEQKCGELEDDELDKVAGGQVLSRQEQGCVLCGCKRGVAAIDGDTCPDCGHPLVCHT